VTIWRPALCNRYEAQRSVDFKPGVDVNDALDRALMSAAEDIEGGLGRVFYPSDDTRYWDWPNQGGSGGGQYADPWRLWFDENDLVAMTALVAGGVSITLDKLFLRPWDNPRKFRPYFTYVEIDRSTSASFGNQQQTPQQAIGITGTWGYGADADPAGTLAADVGLADATVTASDGSKAGPGDLVILGYGRGPVPFPGSDPHAGAIAPYAGERCLVTDVSAVATGLTQSGSGCTTDQDNDQQLQWTGTGALNPGEVITLDSEDMYVEKITGSVATVRRAFNGSTLASHSGAVVYAWRQWQVLRAQLGTTASTYDSGAAVVRHRVPQLVRDLAIGVSEDQVMQEGAGYARVAGTGDNAVPMTVPVSALGSKWMAARRRHGRAGNGSRQRTV
jgi:hypothetical protein